MVVVLCVLFVFCFRVSKGYLFFLREYFLVILIISYLLFNLLFFWDKWEKINKKGRVYLVFGKKVDCFD